MTIAIPQTLTWKGGLLPENANDATVTVAADDADLVALNPFLAAADVIATTGRWTGEASVSFKDGKPAVPSMGTPRLPGVTPGPSGQPPMPRTHPAAPGHVEGSHSSLYTNDP